MVRIKLVNGIVAPMTISDLKREAIYVFKWSYPKSSRISEREMIIKVRKVLERHDNSPDPSGKSLTMKISNSLPDVLSGYDFDERDSLFREFLGVGIEEERILRFTIQECLEPIHTLPDLVKFKEATRHIALAIHYLASNKEGIRHRDINVNNLMFRRLIDGQIQGVLCDWDQASTYDTEKSPNHPRRRNGTMAFLSIDMHETPPPVHIERFDFESLLYVMYWISVNYSEGKLLPEKEKQTNSDEWKFRNLEQDDPLIAMKRHFLSRTRPSSNSPELITPSFMPLVSLWLNPLRRQFRDRYVLRGMHEDPAEPLSLASTANAESNQDSVIETIPPRFDNATLGGRVCFQKIWAILEK